jgi:ADP-ribosylglycohydrolase
MRCAPVALKWRQSGHHLVEESIKSSLITHYDPRCVWSVVAANCVIALILNASTPDCEKLVAALDSAGAPANVGAAIRDSQKCNLEALVLDGPDMGYTLKALQVGFWALQQGDDYENLLVKVVNAGGDTDTNGAVAGAVMGARHGLSAIPKRWVEHIRDTGRLIALADRLFETCRSSWGNKWKC